MGWVDFMGNELSKQVWNQLSKLFFIQALGRQSDTCFRIPWQILMLCFTKLWKQRIMQPKINGHVSSFFIGIQFVTMKSVVNKTMCLLVQKTPYMVCVCSCRRLLIHLNEAATSQDYQDFPKLVQSSWGWGIYTERKGRNCRASLWAEEGFHPSYQSVVP